MERPIIKDKNVLAYVEYLEQELEKFTQSPFKNSYITLKGQIDSFNDQLTIKDPKITKIVIEGKLEELETIPGKLDLFAGKDNKEFDRGFKYLLECVDLNKNLAELKKLLTPEERKDVETRLQEAAPLAERIALKNR